MIGPSVALLLAAQAPESFDLSQLLGRGEELDGRWVEFNAYVVPVQGSGEPPTLSAMTGMTHYLVNGRATTIWCDDYRQSNVAVLLGRNGLGPLNRRAAVGPRAYQEVRIRGILRARPYSFRAGRHRHEWVASVDHARIVRTTGELCLTRSWNMR